MAFYYFLISLTILLLLGFFTEVLFSAFFNQYPFSFKASVNTFNNFTLAFKIPLYTFFIYRYISLRNFINQYTLTIVFAKVTFGGGGGGGHGNDALKLSG